MSRQPGVLSGAPVIRRPQSQDQVKVGDNMTHYMAADCSVDLETEPTELAGSPPELHLPDQSPQPPTRLCSIVPLNSATRAKCHDPAWSKLEREHTTTFHTLQQT